MNSFFAVVIPLYNKKNHIKKTIRSVLNQEFKDYKIIVVNDDSTDGSATIVKALNHPKIILFHQKNKGVSAARNFGAKNAAAKYITFLDADDLWYPNHLTELKKSIDLFPKAGAFSNNYRIALTDSYVRNTKFSFDFSATPTQIKDYFTCSMYDELTMVQCIAIKKQVFEKIGGFDSQLKVIEDVDFLIRLGLNEQIIFNPETTVVYRKQAAELSRKEYNQERLNLLCKYLKEAQKKPSLKNYLNRSFYALAIRAKINKQSVIAKSSLAHIEHKKLNLKQRVLLKLPRVLLIIFIKLQKILIKNKIYITAFR